MNHTTTLRCPSPAAAFLASEAVRQSRPLVQIVGAAARALESLPEREREAFTIGEPPSIETAKTLLDRTRPAKPNRRKGGAR
jgi:hypothetical protein